MAYGSVFCVHCGTSVGQTDSFRVRDSAVGELQLRWEAESETRRATAERRRAVLTT